MSITRALAVLLAGACLACTSKEEQIEKCGYIAGQSGIGECLVSRYNWDVNQALVAALDFRLQQDSLLRAYNEQQQKEALERKAHHDGAGYVLLDHQGP